MSSERPLAGIRVVDLTTAWSGPMAGRILGYLGAEVIHIESPTRLDVWRHYHHMVNPSRYPDGDPNPRQYNRIALFNSQNTDKLSLVLDLKRDGGIETILKLVGVSDVVLSNYTPGALKRLGLGYDQLRKIRDDIIVVEMPAYGNFGPMAKYSGLGPTMEMATSMAAMVGYPGGSPTTTGPSYPDPMGGMHGAAAVLTALIHRDMMGAGQYVEVPQVEAAMHFIGEHILHAMATGVDPVPQGNRVSWAAPHDTFPARGDDQWIAIAVTDDAAWRALCMAIGTPDLASDARFATLPDRLRHQDELIGPIAAWTRPRDKHKAAQILQRAGVMAAPVQDAKDVVNSAYLAERGYFRELDHLEAGRHRHSGLPFHLSLTPGGMRRAAPCLGQHTHMILREILRLPEAEIERLERAGTITNLPAY